MSTTFSISSKGTTALNGALDNLAWNKAGFLKYEDLTFVITTKGDELPKGTYLITYYDDDSDTTLITSAPDFTEAAIKFAEAARAFANNENHDDVLRHGAGA